MKSLTTFAAAFITMSLATSLQAHPGHGTIPSDQVVSHHLLEPMHIPIVLALLAILGIGIRVVARRTTNRNPKR